MIINIKHFQKNQQGFLNHVKAFNPTAIVIDLCYSKDGDVANLLQSSGILSDMWLSAERNLILGVNDQWIKLGKEQKQVIDLVASGIKMNTT